MNANKIFFVVAILLITNNLSGQVFTEQTSAYQPVDITSSWHLSGIHAVDTSIAYIIGFNATSGKGFIQKTTDSGQNWNLLDSNFTGEAHAIAFLDEDTGYIAGTRVYKTTDAGQTWEQTSAPVIPHFYYTDVEIADNGRTVWVTGPGDDLTYSLDYGVTWTHQTVGSGRLDDVLFVDSNTAFIAGNSGVIKKTTNGGATWLTMNIGTSNDLWSLSWTGSNLFVLSGIHIDETFTIANEFCYTGDLIQWTCMPLPTALNSFTFINDSTGIATGTEHVDTWNGPGYVMKTLDMGQTWDTIFNSPGFPQYPGGFYKQSFLQEGKGWIIDNHRIFHTSNALTTIAFERQTQNQVVYPNPCHSAFNIKLDSKDLNPQQFAIHDSFGKSYPCSCVVSDDAVSVNVEGLSPGMYVVSYTVNNTEKKYARFVVY
jgi:photosystem II stability/assembly factor-like uncharacterized protein